MSKDIQRILRGISTKKFEGLLYRCVPQLHFDRESVPSYLLTSGSANRCNPAGVRCVYFSEDEATAAEEYRQQWRGTKAEHQPKLTFCAKVNFTRSLDLGDEAMVQTLGLAAADFYGAWRQGGGTKLQQLGGILDQGNQENPIASVRYPSRAARLAGACGFNWVIYQNGVIPPDFVHILGAGEKPLESWPE